MARKNRKHKQPRTNPSGRRSSGEEEEEEEEASGYSERERDDTPTPPPYVESGANSSSSGSGGLTTQSQDSVNEAALPVPQPSWRPPIPLTKGIWKPIRVETNGAGKKKLFEGDMLVEVYDVTVDLCGKTSGTGNIHGKVILDCMIYQIDLFNRDKETAHVIHEKGSLPLDGPDLAPLGYDPGAILFDLKIDDKELCKEVITWNPSYVRTNEWLEKEVQGRNGCVLVTYAVMLDACLAEVDVKLIQCAQQATVPFRIHGDIVVYINDMTYLRYFAFSKKIHNSTIIKPLDPIPLSRSDEF